MELAAIDPFDPFDCAQGKTFAANDFMHLLVRAESGLCRLLLLSTQTNNAQRSTLNVSMEAARFEVLNVGRWALGVGR